jgi:diguanylate cyclase (GGDEF)-like protein
MERLLERWRPYDARRLTRRELRVETAAAVAFAAAATAMAVLLPHSHPFDPLLALSMVAGLALASGVRLHLGAGYSMPTQLMLVPMLFLLPPATVPACVGVGLAGAALMKTLRRQAHPERIVTGTVDAWHAVAPSLVFVAAGGPSPELQFWAVPLVAVLAQCATDLVSGTLREWIGRGIAPSVQLRVILAVYLIDACLTPVGFLIALAAAEHAFVFALALPLLALLAVLADDRRRRIREAVDRLDELTVQHERLDRAVHRIGEAFGSRQDRMALVDIGLRTAVEALGAEFGRANLASGTIELGGGPADAAREAERAAQRGVALCMATVDDQVALAHPLAAGGRTATTEVLVVARRGRPFTQEEQALFGYLAQQTALAVENVELQHQLRHQATVDEVTGLSNHRRFQEALSHEVVRTRRSGLPTALALVDVDDFKTINDTYGHQLGDVVLEAVAHVIRGACRSTDEPARYGGDELAVVLPETDIAGAWTIGESIRRAVAALEVRLPDGRPVRTTVSVGVSALEPDSGDASTLIEAADIALYDAKRAGKNRTRSTGWARTAGVDDRRAGTRFARAASANR